jgi:hypothetical protein
MRRNTPFLIKIPEVLFPEDKVNINVFELKDIIPFKVKRVYTIRTGSQDTIRGNHAHLNQHQVICMLKGTAKVELTNFKGQIHEFVLNKDALFIPQNHWIVIVPEQNSILISFASLPYNQLISVFDKQKFLSQNQ